MIPKLNLGCGNSIMPGYVNADLARLVGVDWSFDMDVIPWVPRFPVPPFSGGSICPFHDGQICLPIPDDYFDEVQAIHVLEHSRDLIRVVGELWRVTKHGALVHVEAPHFQKTALDVWGDPTHRSPMGPATFRYWYPGMPLYAHEVAALSPARFIILAENHSDYYLSWDLAVYKQDDPALLARHRS